MEDLELIIESVKEQMESALGHLEYTFKKIRAGRASAAMVQDVMVEYYGTESPIQQVANIQAPDAMTITIQPWDKNAISAIEKGIINANLGFAPSNNGEMVIINVPALTEERRKELAKQAKAESENAKVVIRNARQDGNKDLKKLDGVSEDMVKDIEAEIQNLTDSYVQKVDQYLKVKEAEIMKV